MPNPQREESWHECICGTVWKQYVLPFRRLESDPYFLPHPSHRECQEQARQHREHMQEKHRRRVLLRRMYEEFGPIDGVGALPDSLAKQFGFFNEVAALL